ncbi:MAG TPA: DNA alkylation repair protein [Blastocatellia bacterium]|nr:DNA alkylation repair protein [Blastocatellia bacterium]
MTITNEIRARMRELADDERAHVLQRFFKTGPGEYGEGDLFLGITIPELRKLAKQYRSVRLEEVLSLLTSRYHEERVLALLMMIDAYSKGDEAAKERIYRLYLKNTRFINNWDLVDLSAPRIVGDFLLTRSREPLYTLARSESLWERRIAIMSTFQFIKKSDYFDSLKISEMLLKDTEDLIHKAVGWMLREIGKSDLPVEENFLREHYRLMPRTMLRYAIERFPEPKRQMYLKGQI